jgi:hypothetical protein
MGLATGLDWNNVKTTANFAFGTKLWDGSHLRRLDAILTGTWNKNQRVRGGDSHRQPERLDESGGRAVAALDGHGERQQRIRSRGEVHDDGTQYTDIVRWNGAIGSFTSLAILNNTGFRGSRRRRHHHGGNDRLDHQRLPATAPAVNTVTDTTFARAIRAWGSG